MSNGVKLSTSSEYGILFNIFPFKVISIYHLFKTWYCSISFKSKGNIRQAWDNINEKSLLPKEYYLVVYFTDLHFLPKSEILFSIETAA